MPFALYPGVQIFESRNRTRIGHAPPIPRSNNSYYAPAWSAPTLLYWNYNCYLRLQFALKLSFEFAVLLVPSIPFLFHSVVPLLNNNIVWFCKWALTKDLLWIRPICSSKLAPTIAPRRININVRIMQSLINNDSQTVGEYDRCRLLEWGAKFACARPDWPAEPPTISTVHICIYVAS